MAQSNTETTTKRRGVMPEYDRVRSADGTSIGFAKLGQGPALVICHGSLSTGHEWLPVATRLANRFTCYIMTRRGRGRSQANAQHAIERECEDMDAMLDIAGGHAHVLGHSFGALCALETARHSTAIDRLVLYEPPLPVEPVIVDTELDLYRKAVADDRFEDALKIGFRTFVGMPESELEALRKMLIWPGTIKLAPTWLPELEAIVAMKPGTAQYASINSNTLLLLGTESARHLRAAVAALGKALPCSQTAVLDGQGHSAHIMAPARFAATIGDFLPHP